jgi:hypothetical protein
MAYKEHIISAYKYSISSSGGPFRLQLWGEMSKVAEIRFVADGKPVPPPVFWDKLSGVNASFEARHLPAIIDMLRNEDPVSLLIDDQPPGFVFIQTAAEYVGEGEQLNKK